MSDILLVYRRIRLVFPSHDIQFNVETSVQQNTDIFFTISKRHEVFYPEWEGLPALGVKTILASLHFVEGIILFSTACSSVDGNGLCNNFSSNSCLY